MTNDKIVQTTIIGNVYKENKGKTYRLNNLLEEYFGVIKLYVSTGLREMGWRRSDPLGPTNENIDVKSNLNVGSFPNFIGK